MRSSSMGARAADERAPFLLPEEYPLLHLRMQGSVERHKGEVRGRGERGQI